MCKLIIKNEIFAKESDIVYAELFKAISHPIRIYILRNLNKRSLGFVDLKKNLKISSSGNLNHHLNKLMSLVNTDDIGKYNLTDQGREALYTINSIKINEKNWLLSLIALISTIIIYSIILTIIIVMEWWSYTKIPFILIPLSAILFIFGYYLILRIFYIKFKRKS